MPVNTEHPKFAPQTYHHEVLEGHIVCSPSYGWEGDYRYYPAWMDPKGTIIATPRHESIGDGTSFEPYSVAYREGYIRLTIGRTELGLQNTVDGWIPTDEQISAIRALYGLFGQTTIVYSFYTVWKSVTTVDEVVEVLTRPKERNPFASDNPDDWDFLK